MNKIRYGIILVFFALLVNPQVISGKTVKVAISGSTEEIEALDKNEITYFSFSGLADLLGGQLDWSMVGQKINYVDDPHHFEFILDSPFFTLDAQTYNLTYPAVMEDGQLFLPAETFLAYLDRIYPQKITWDKKTDLIRVDSEYFNVVDFSIAQKTNGLLIEIFLSNDLAYDIFVTEGNWMNISIRDAKINRTKILSRKNSRFMYRLKNHQDANSGQISFQLKKNIEKWQHKLVQDPPRIQISIADVNFELDTADTNPQIGPDNKINVIVIDPGHGGSDYGAIGRGGTREKDVVMDIARELAKLIRKEKQFKVIMTRDRDKFLTLQQRADIANNAGADLFISIHANASPKHYIRGWNVFFLAEAKNDSARAVAQFENSVFLREQNAFEAHHEDGNYETINDPILNIINEMIMTEFQAESHDFALMCDREFRKNLDVPARGVDQAGFFVLNMVFTPSVLIESGFISNTNEEKLLKSGKYQKNVAQAIYNALKRFKSKYEG